LAAACAAPPATAPAATTTAVVFDGARIVTGEDRPPIERGMLVVDRGRIVAVAEAGQLAVPSCRRSSMPTPTSATCAT